MQRYRTWKGIWWGMRGRVKERNRKQRLNHRVLNLEHRLRERVTWMQQSVEIQQLSRQAKSRKCWTILRRSFCRKLQKKKLWL
mmetsp:Transcript_37722/g.92712  ORF Transcript_37722/g.92712 Transcript_37722/m.92712 type:complete len:83 (+) Transcript_37722:109-357(+)